MLLSHQAAALIRAEVFSCCGFPGLEQAQRCRVLLLFAMSRRGEGCSHYPGSDPPVVSARQTHHQQQLGQRSGAANSAALTPRSGYAEAQRELRQKGSKRCCGEQRNHGRLRVLRVTELSCSAASTSSPRHRLLPGSFSRADTGDFPGTPS